MWNQFIMYEFIKNKTITHRMNKYIGVVKMAAMFNFEIALLAFSLRE